MASLLLAVVGLSCDKGSSAVQLYSETLQDVYLELTEKYIPAQYQGNLTFYRDYPHKVAFTKSTVKGAALEFIPAERMDVEVRQTDEKIEQAIFQDEQMSTGMAIFVIGGTGNGIRNIAFETGTGYVVEVLPPGSVWIHDLLVDGVAYTNPIMIKGDNQLQSWTPEIAVQDAYDKFGSDIGFTFMELLDSDEFQQSFARPDLEPMVMRILEKEQAGDYCREGGQAEREKDLYELYSKAAELGVSNDYVDGLLKFYSEQEEARHQAEVLDELRKVTSRQVVYESVILPHASRNTSWQSCLLIDDVKTSL